MKFKTIYSVAYTYRCKEIKRYCKELSPGNRHSLLTLLTNDLHEGLGLLRSIIPVAAVGGFHD